MHEKNRAEVKIDHTTARVCSKFHPMASY